MLLIDLTLVVVGISLIELVLHGLVKLLVRLLLVLKGYDLRKHFLMVLASFTTTVLYVMIKSMLKCVSYSLLLVVVVNQVGVLLRRSPFSVCAIDLVDGSQ